MGKTKPNPRRHVLCCRASDTELQEIKTAIGEQSRSDFFLDAILAKARELRERPENAVRRM